MKNLLKFSIFSFLFSFQISNDISYRPNKKRGPFVKEIKQQKKTKFVFFVLGKKKTMEVFFSQLRDVFFLAVTASSFFTWN